MSATTMNSLTEALGMSLTGSAAIPAPYRDRQEVAYHTDKRIVEMLAEDLKPSRIDLRRGTADILVAEEELAARRAQLEADGGFRYPASQTPWQQIQRRLVGQMDTGAILEGAETFQRIAQTAGIPRDSH